MNFNDSKSIYQQIATRICDEIMLGVYEEGNRIPSVRDYASQMEVNAQIPQCAHTDTLNNLG